jgi:hypothetical protein
MSSQQSKKIRVALPAKGLPNIPRNVYQNDFTFIVDHSRYECPLIFAAFLSLRIGFLQSNDPTIEEFVIEMKNPHQDFRQIIDLCSGLIIWIDFADFSFFVFLGKICGKLWNRELYEQIL